MVKTKDLACFLYIYAIFHDLLLGKICIFHGILSILYVSLITIILVVENDAYPKFEICDSGFPLENYEDPTGKIQQPSNGYLNRPSQLGLQEGWKKMIHDVPRNNPNLPYFVCRCTLYQMIVSA